MKVLITGGYGFIGSYVADLFSEEGHDVFILDDLSKGNRSFVRSAHTPLIGDVRSPGCEAFFREYAFDTVLHLAAQTSVQQSILDPAEDTRINVGGLVNMLHLSARYSVKQFVFASSAAVYGDSGEPFLTEQAACRPASPYGMNKKVGEYCCRQWESMFGLNSVCLRFSNVYGPRQAGHNEQSVIPVFIDRMLRSEPLPVYGDGEQTRDFIYVEDISKAIYLACVNRLSGVYNVSASVPHSVNGVIDILKGMEPGLETAQLPERAGDIKHSLLDSGKLKRALGWEPRYTLREGLEKTYSFVKEHLYI